MPTKWRDEIPQLLIIVGMFAAAGLLWPFAPDRLPVHWNIAGHVDRYGGKFEGLLLMPLIALGAYLLLLLLPRIDPNRANYAKFAVPYAAVRLAAICLLAVVEACIALVGFGYPVNVGRIVPFGVGLLFCVIGNLMPKFQRNWFVGVRTPWTLSSRASWHKTHRLAGRLFIVSGIALCALAFIQTPWMLALVVGMFVVILVWVTAYSYVIWRHDPERAGAGDSPP